MSRVEIVAVIPARMASSRFPGKPLLEVRGLPMVEHVRRRALLCGRFAEVVVATCDREIAETIARYGGRCVLTSPSHPAATDRVAEAAQGMKATHIVNVQGDEILVLPEDLGRLVAAIEADAEAPAWNAVARLERSGELSNRSLVKCAVSGSGRMLYCMRDVSPLGTALDGTWEPLRVVLGILAYRRDFLLRYGTLSRMPLERAEAVDQWRILEHDVPLRTVEFSRGYPGINDPCDAAQVECWLDDDPRQRDALSAVLAHGQAPASAAETEGGRRR